MVSALVKLPFFVILMGMGALAMLVPSVHGAVTNDFVTMRVFFYGTILFGILTLLVGLATANNPSKSLARNQLLTLLFAFTLLPLMLAIPFAEAIGSTTYLHAWFEMVSSFTTTGATLYENHGRLTPSLHLWRSTVGWMGGFLIWVTAVAIFAPMNLGGFEVQAKGQIGGKGAVSFTQIAKVVDPAERLLRYAAKLAPIYIGLTLLLWLLLTLAGEFPYIGLCHAMAILSTSGISPIDGVYYAASGFWGEFFMLLFLVFAISRLTFSSGIAGEESGKLTADPEMKVAAILISTTTVLLVGRHYFGGADFELDNFQALLSATWGTLFTVTSFLTTTGFESRFWDGATQWSGLDTPGLLLVGLALIGGGVATTAGGVKLLRVYALFRHSEREMERLLHPSSVGGGGKDARRIRKQGAYISWIFFMLFAVSIATVMLLTSLTGLQFETSMVLSVAALSTTGPLASVAAEAPISFTGIPDLAKFILATAMVLGRLETLAIIALFNPDFWRS